VLVNSTTVAGVSSPPSDTPPQQPGDTVSRNPATPDHRGRRANRATRQRTRSTQPPAAPCRHRHPPQVRERRPDHSARLANRRSHPAPSSRPTHQHRIRRCPSRRLRDQPAPITSATSDAGATRSPEQLVRPQPVHAARRGRTGPAAHAAQHARPRASPQPVSAQRQSSSPVACSTLPASSMRAVKLLLPRSDVFWLVRGASDPRWAARRGGWSGFGRAAACTGGGTTRCCPVIGCLGCRGSVSWSRSGRWGPRIACWWVGPTTCGVVRRSPAAPREVRAASRHLRGCRCRPARGGCVDRVR